MKKVLCIGVFWAGVSMGCQTMAQTPGFENFSTPYQDVQSDREGTIRRIDRIEIYVQSRKIRIVQENKDGSLAEEFSAGTATPRNARAIPYGIVGSAYKVTLNPTYRPTEDHIKKERAKGKKIVREIGPNDPSNPLGKMKIYFAFPNIDPKLSFGAHGTNNPKSVGKRSSEGCVRLKGEDIEEIVRLLLEQNGFDSETVFKQARENEGTPYQYILKRRPRIVFLKG